MEHKFSSTLSVFGQTVLAQLHYHEQPLIQVVNLHVNGKAMVLVQGHADGPISPAGVTTECVTTVALASPMHVLNFPVVNA